MKNSETGRMRSRKGLVFGTVAVLALCGGIAVAEMQSGKIELKKDDSAKTQPQTQAKPAPTDPFRDMLRLQQEMDHMFNSTLNPYFGFPEFDAVWNQQLQLPAMDLREQPDAYTVQMDLPGIEKSEISIEIKDQVLTVSAEHKVDVKKQDNTENVLLQERGISSFSREVVLPRAVNADQVSAEYKNGVLTITLPKMEKDQTAQKIEVK